MNYLELDYDHMPCKAQIYKKGVLIKKWSVNKPIDLVDQVIDSMDISGFGKINMKKAIRTITDVFEPKKIKIIEKETHERNAESNR